MCFLLLVLDCWISGAEDVVVTFFHKLQVNFSCMHFIIKSKDQALYISDSGMLCQIWLRNRAYASERDVLTCGKVVTIE